MVRFFRYAYFSSDAVEDEPKVASFIRRWPALEEESYASQPHPMSVLTGIKRGVG